MIPGNDADDMMRRGFLSSIMPFRRKSLRPAEQNVRSHASSSRSRPTASLHPLTPPPQPVSLPPLPVVAPLTPTFERTQHDIFREIVSECAHLERSSTTTPFSDLSSAPTSPLTPLAPSTSPVACLQSPMCAPPSVYPSVPTSMYESIPNYAPPPYSNDPHLYPAPPQHYGMPPIMMPGHPHQQVPNHLIEEVVKMVVSAMSQSSLGDPQKENPEEILRRKRNQNNEAAARYRKRQRAIRQRAEEELAILGKRNDDLRSTVNHMESEIQQLKQMVLAKKD